MTEDKKWIIMSWEQCEIPLGSILPLTELLRVEKWWKDDKDGNRIPEAKYAEKAAEYLHKVQWAKVENLPENEERENIKMEGLEFKTTPFDIRELCAIIQNKE